MRPDRCLTPEAACEFFEEKSVSLPEKNLLLYLSTTALYNFCDTDISAFSFDEYLFKLHDKLYAKFEKDLHSLSLSEEEKEEMLDAARSNVFACDTIQNIAIRVLNPFVYEFEEKLSKGNTDFHEDIEMPFKWDVDKELMRIRILNFDESLRDEINMLDVKERK